MKTTAIFILAALATALTASAEVITWTNTSNGNWNTAANWNPNQVPSTNDTAVITNPGTYTVTLNVHPTIAGLIVGGATGTQTVATAGRTLTLNGQGDVNVNGLLLLSGGALSGTNRIGLSGSMTWESGMIDTNTTLVVSPGGSLTLASAGNAAKLLHGGLTNAGLMTWRMYGNLGIGGTLHNLAGGVFDAQVENRSITRLREEAVIVNAGVFRKSAGSGDLPCGVPLHNSGTVDTLIGTLTLLDGSVLESGSTFTGAGQTRLGEGSHMLNGDLHATNLVLDGATLMGTCRLNGLATWSYGTLTSGGALTVTAGSHLLFSSSGNFTRFVQGNLTNAGTVTFSTYGNLSIGATFHNLPGALFDAQTDNRVIAKGDSAAVLINDGVFRRSLGSSVVRCQVPIINSGTVEALSGTLAIEDTFTNAAGTISMAGGSLSATQPLFLAGGLLTGWGTLSADVTNAATIRPSRSNGVLLIRGMLDQQLGGRMEFELAGNTPGTDQSCLNITGPARLRGSLGVRWADGYLPEPGTDFSVMTFASRKGDFCCLDNLLLLGHGRRLTPLFGPTNLTLATIAAPEPTTVPLRVTVDGDALVCWPVEMSGYQLFWSTNLTQTNWTLLPGVTSHHLETPPLAREKFYQLRRQ